VPKASIGSLVSGKSSCSGLVLTDSAAARAQVDKDREETLAVSAGDLAKALGAGAPPADEGVMLGGMADYMAQVVHDGAAPGSEGLWDDVCATVARPWGFELADISVPVLLLQGRTRGFPWRMAGGSPHISAQESRQSCRHARAGAVTS
jgi:hypothetical protein